MPTPTVITDLDPVAANNFPAGSNAPSVLDDVQRAHGAFIRQLLNATQAQTYTAFTTGGTSTDYTLTPSPAITAYAAGQSFWVTLHTASGASPTLNINGLGATVNIVRRLQDGSFQNVSSLPAGAYRITLVSTTLALAESVGPLIVGTVSQSAGVPTGAIIERGSNANGEYVRLADGTQICTMSLNDQALAANFTGSLGSLTFPAAFIVAPYMSGSAGPNLNFDWYGVTGFTALTTTSVNIVARNGATAQTAIFIRATATGRWY